VNFVGQLLVAPPAQDDEFWQNSVIFIYEHAKTTVGITLNKKSERTIAELANYHNLSYVGRDLINVGGLMNPAALIMLHSNDWKCNNTMYIDKGICISSDNTMLARICAGDRPRKWRLFLGMCVWSIGQLNNEINGTGMHSKKHAWLVAPANPDIVFERNPQRMWNKALESAVKHATDSFFFID
jgi:putative transcriptional regulator